MPRALVVYGDGEPLAALAGGLARGLSQKGCQVELMSAAERGQAAIPVGHFDLVCVGGAVVSFFGGRIGDEVAGALQRMRRLEGKKAAAFILPRTFGATRALRGLMGLLEAQGAWVEDFAALRTPREAEAFGRRLGKLTRPAGLA